MASCSVLKLKIWRTGDNYCVFELDDGKKSLSATVKYSDSLDESYQKWLRTYLDAYSNRSFLQPRIPDDDYLNPNPPLDRGNNRIYESEKAKKILLFKFHEWLGDAKLNKIREKIRSEIHQKIIQRNKERGNHYCVELLIACDSDRLAKLPWEAWEIAPKKIPSGIFRISRSFIDVEEEPIFIEKEPRRGKKRVLFILGYAPDLDLDPNRKAVEKLKKIADVKEVQFDPAKDSPEQFIQDFRKTLVDDRGWDALIFAGHSDEAEYTGGKIQLAPHIYLAISQIEGELLQAKKQGLQVAIFNSCRGFNIAQSLIRLGLRQVVIMREKIHISAAVPFLEEFCESLAAYQDIQDAVLAAYEKLREDQLTYPSASLIPSLFRHPASEAELFRFLLPPWKRFIRDWSPTKGEVIAVGSAMLLSLMFPLHNLFSDFRYATQAFHRDLLQTTSEVNTNNHSLPVSLVEIDQESITWATSTIPNFKQKPMDRELLAMLVDKLRKLEVKVIGINYGLYEETEPPKTQLLAKAIQSTIKEQGSWFVFGGDEDENRLIYEKIVHRAWILDGYTNIKPWDIEHPLDRTCAESRSCPFSYLLALSYLLSQESSLVETSPKTITKYTETNSLIPKDYFHKILSKDLKENEDNIPYLNLVNFPLGIHPIIDFSIAPQTVYQSISAKELYALPTTHSKLQSLKQGIVIITSGDDQNEAEDHFGRPIAFQYWCWADSGRTRKKQACRQNLTGGEIDAYAIEHYLYWLSGNGTPAIWLVNSLLMIALAGLLGKFIVLIMLKLKTDRQKKLNLGLATITVVYIIFTSQLYISTSVAIPVFLPVVTFWIYIILFFRSKYRGSIN